MAPALRGELAPRLRGVLGRLERLPAEVRLVEAEHGGGLRAGREDRLQMVAEALLRAPGHREELNALRPGVVERVGLADAPVVGPRDARRKRGEVRRRDLVEADAALRARVRMHARGKRESEEDRYVRFHGGRPGKRGKAGGMGSILPERGGQCKKNLVCNWYSLFACGRRSVPIEFPA